MRCILPALILALLCGCGRETHVRNKTSDGRRLCIGGPGATPDAAGFVGMLQEGGRYSFPDAFLEYRQRQGERR
jgi:hypothetical protein